MTPHYHINVFWHDPDSCWIADVPDLRYCSAHGETPEEAFAEIQIAMALWIEVALERGLTLPEANYKPLPIAQAA
jgi:predicted RNase H-like HicB family nuclease